MKILVTGGTGFTGRRVLPLLKDKGEISLFARKSSDVILAHRLGYEVVYGDLERPSTLEQAMKDKDGLINIASIGFGHADQIVSLAEDMGIQRALFVSTTSLFTKLPAPSKKVRQAAEDRIQNSKLNWTIIRPTMIYGGPDDRNMFRLLKFLKRFPIIPIPGNGKALQQPIFVEDLAQAIVDAFFCEQAIGKCYNVSGKEPLTFDEVIDTAAKALNIRRAKFHIPLGLVRPFVKFYEFLVSRPRIKDEQLLRLVENKDFSHEEAAKDFNFKGRSYEAGISELAKEFQKQL